VESQETGDERQELTTREVFERRAKIISSLRHFLEDHGYIEVETPMLTPKATGAVARPFKTHHNALDIDLTMRIAPELYLKRLVVGGFEKVYELNRNFRNEGISYKHNPEFTMLEFYCAYMDVEGMMNFCEELMRQSVQKATGGYVVNYEGKDIDFSVFKRVPMNNAVQQSWNDTFIGSQINDDWFKDSTILRRILVFPRLMDIEINNSLNANISFGEPPDGTVSDLFTSTVKSVYTRKYAEVWEKTRLFEDSVPSENEARVIGIEREFLALIVEDLNGTDWSDRDSMSKLVEKFFERYTEKQLGIHEEKDRTTIVQPTFIIDYPKITSPLSKASSDNPNIAERFELFINGMEVANGFSELNDPKEQYERFVDQMSERERGDEEAMILDEDYIRALSYGMPPAAGTGIGIDRLVMLLTNKHSIRDVILFPHMRPERNSSATEDTENEDT
jgi:lysyl-tRNA synthetase class 2